MTAVPTQIALDVSCASCREARAASKAKSAFLADMSHELRTPLNAVIGFTAVLLRNKGDVLAPQELAYLQRIRENGTHLLRLINNVLDLSKVEAGKMEVRREPVPLQPFIESTLAQLAGGVPSPVTLKAQVPRGLQPLLTDPDKLRQVVINLVGNAVKFTPRGSVTVWVAGDDEGRPVRLDVIDTGIGIPADRQEAIFEAFQQAEGGLTYGGTGLGLTISRSLAELLGYRLSLTSEPGQGTTFSIHF